MIKYLTWLDNAEKTILNYQVHSSECFGVPLHRIPFHIGVTIKLQRWSCLSSCGGNWFRERPWPKDETLLIQGRFALALTHNAIFLSVCHFATQFHCFECDAFTLFTVEDCFSDFNGQMKMNPCRLFGKDTRLYSILFGTLNIRIVVCLYHIY